jgi:carbonic anhydrase
MKTTLLFLVAALLGLAACNDVTTLGMADAVTPQANFKAIADSSGTATGFPDVCKTTLGQSPIDIPAAGIVPFVSQDPQIHYRPFELTSIQHTGENLRINVPAANNKSFITIRGKRYDLRQFHFHRSSEHALKGEKGAMEAHFVHVAADGSIAVIGVLVQLGVATNGPLGVLLRHSPGQPGVVATNQSFNPVVLLPADPDRYYTYCGSLTTAPFTERLTWIVCKQTLHMTWAQLNRYAKLYPEENARELQPLNGRSVFEQVGGATLAGG